MDFRRSHFKSEKALLHGVRQGFVCWKGVGMLLVLVLLGLTGLAQAQPQAPVVWGEMRWFGINNTPEYPSRSVFMGDTLILFGALQVQQSPALYCRAVIHSHDNGQTFGTWHILDTTRYMSGSLWTPLFGRNGQAFALVKRRLERSTDAGITWTTNRLLPPTDRFGFGVFSNLQVITLDWTRLQDSSYAITAAISDDGGDHWRTGIPIPYNPQELAVCGVAATQNRIFIMGYTEAYPHSLMVATCNRSGAQWTSFVSPPATPRGIAGFPIIIGDDDSETAIITQMVSRGSWRVIDIFINRTTDGGLTWEFEQNLSEGHQLLYIADPLPFYCGRLWGIVWEDYWNSDTTQWGVYWRLSANHGKDWYPAQPLGFDIPGMSYSDGQFVGNEVRLYWIDERNDFGTISGILTPDTIAPAIAIVSSLPDTIRVSDTLNVAVFVSENDTLSGVRLQLRGDTGEHWTVPMTRRTGGEYHAAWIVPCEDRYRYWFEAEDFWENIGYLPEGEEFQFVTEGWSAVDPFVVYPSLFSVSVFPNPSNGWPTITLSPNWFQHGPVTMTIFNVLGQNVLERIITAPAALSPEVPAASGIYLLHVAGAQHSTLRKFVVLK